MDYGDLKLTEAEKLEFLPTTVTFQVYKGTDAEEAENNGAIASKLYAVGDFDLSDPEAIKTVLSDLTVNGTATELPQLSEGEHYYLKESFTVPDGSGENWFLLSADVESGDRKGSLNLPADGSGMIQIDLDTDGDEYFNDKQDVSLYVTNKIGMAQIVIKKISTNGSLPLEGAKFAVYTSLTLMTIRWEIRSRRQLQAKTGRQS